MLDNRATWPNMITMQTRYSLRQGASLNNSKYKKVQNILNTT